MDISQHPLKKGHDDGVFLRPQFSTELHDHKLLQAFAHISAWDLFFF